MIYPVTIMLSRYGGIYEGGDWLAFNTDPNAIKSAAWSSDPECAAYWHEQDRVGTPIGRGVTPDDALADLARRLGEDL